MANYVFNVPQQYAGKSLSDLRNMPNGLEYVPEQRLWDAPYEAPLTAGQNLTFSTNEATSGNAGYLSAQRLFGAPLTAEQQAAKAADTATAQTIKSAQALRQFNIESNQPRVAQLQAGKTDLKSRYSEILNSIKGTEQLQSDTSVLNTARELGRRGITGGGVYDTELGNSALNIARQFAPIKADVGLRETQEVKGIDDLIASLLAGNPEQALSSGLSTAQMGQSASQFAQTLLEQQRQRQSEDQYKKDALSNALEVARIQSSALKSSNTSSSLNSLWSQFFPG